MLLFQEEDGNTTQSEQEYYNILNATLKRSNLEQVQSNNRAEIEKYGTVVQAIMHRKVKQRFGNIARSIVLLEIAFQ